jgi:hypothetical protein
MKLNRFLRPRSTRATRRVTTSAIAARPAVEPLEDRQLMSLTIAVRAAGGASSASVTSVGQVVNLQIVATVTGTLNPSQYDGLDTVTGSFLSSETSSANSVAGNLSAFTTFEFHANSAQYGTVQDLNGDGNLDVGSNNNKDAADFFSARAGGAVQDGSVSGNSMTFVIGSLNYTVTNLHNGAETDVNFRLRSGTGSGAFDAVWLEDGNAKNDAPGTDFGTVLTASPFVITDPNLKVTTGSISGSVSKSVNGALSGFSGVTVALKNNSGLNITTPTSSSGAYSFSGLPAGTYDVSETVPSGYTQTSPSSSQIVVTLGTGQNATGEDFVDTANSTTGPTPLKGTVIGTAGSYQNDGNTIAKAFDGNLSTFYDGASANGDWAGLNLGSTYAITSVSYAPRSGWASRMVGGIFQGSNDPTFNSGVTNLATISSTPATGSLTTLSISNTAAFEYVRYLSPNGSYGDVSELNFFGTAKSTTGATPLAGSVIGTAGSYQNNGNTIAKAFDGNLSTFFDGPSANGNWAGLNLGSQYAINKINYAPRSGWASRMVGGIFQGSNDPNFVSGVVNLATISSTPATGSYTSISISNTNGFQYVRYLSPSGSYGDVAELQFFGTAATNLHPKRTGTVIGTAGSYQNDGNTVAKAVDGNASTFFDGATANGNWVGLDLGSAQSIGQISFTPRAGWASRMVGGIFQASNTANFSSGVVNLYTVTSTPSASSTTVSVSVSGTYRYVRYLSPNGSYGDVAEIAFFG